MLGAQFGDDKSEMKRPRWFSGCFYSSASQRPTGNCARKPSLLPEGSRDPNNRALGHKYH